MILLTVLSLLVFVVPLDASTTEQISTGMNMRLKEVALLLPAGLIAIGLRGYIMHVMAHRLGDHYSQADIKPNPGAYIDPMGILILVFFHFGWVRDDIYRKQAFEDSIRDENLLLIGASFFNFLLMLWALILLAATVLINVPPEAIGLLKTSQQFFITLAFVNFMMAFLSLAPCYPLAGYQILFNLLDPMKRFQLEKYQSVTSLFLFGLLFLGEGFLYSIFLKFAGLLTGIPALFLVVATVLATGVFFFLVLKLDKYLLKGARDHD